jgi:outer membrane protein assembly factor BamB
MRRTRPLLLLTLFALTTASAAQADDWPQYLGPKRDGISSEKKLLQKWPADGLEEVWRVDGGVGMSGIVVKGQTLVTMIQTEGSQNVVALNANTGDEIWRQKVAAAYQNGQGAGPRATPAIADERVYAYTGEGILAALDLKTGKVAWKKDTLAELSLRESDYGMASSPLVVDDLVIVMCGGAPGSLAAFDVKDGGLVWRTKSRDTAGYSSPTLLKIGGQEQIVALTGSSVIGVAVKSGETLWRHPFATDFDCNIATPVLFGDSMVLISAGENHGSAMIKIARQGKGFAASEEWASLGRASTLRSAWQTGIVDGNYLFGFDNVGAAGPVMHYTCIDLRDGSQKWTKVRFGKGNHVAADGKLFISTMAGELVVVQMNSGEYEELGRMQVLGTTRQSPTIANGLLYLRDNAQIVCLNVRGK